MDGSERRACVGKGGNSVAKRRQQSLQNGEKTNLVVHGKDVQSSFGGQRNLGGIQRAVPSESEGS